jgi:arylsulfatase A
VLTNPNADYDRLPLINHGFGGRFAITEGRWKLIFPFDKSGFELYDLATDPAEEKNIARQYPDQVERLTKKAANIVLNGRTTPGAVQKNDTGYWNHLTWVTETEYNARQSKGKKDE